MFLQSMFRARKKEKNLVQLKENRDGDLCSFPDQPGSRWRIGAI